jgi:glutamate N-acetyltransferase / amino-acid N-acetyltransferase
LRKIWNDLDVYVKDSGPAGRDAPMSDALEDEVAIRTPDGRTHAVAPTLEHLPRGLLGVARHVGVAKKPGELDFSAVRLERAATAAAVYTRSLCASPAVVFDRENTARGRIQLVCVVSKNANVFTPTAAADVERLAGALASEFRVPPGEVFLSCTGVIGQPLPVERILEGVRGLEPALGPGQMDAVSTAIMTTDKRPKRASIRVGDLVVGGYAKGAGMIEPNMATMLVYLYTNAALDKEALDRALKAAVDRTFNAISVDSDTSTSDSVLLLATGERAPDGAERIAFEAALAAVCLKLARQVAGEAEGATKLLEVTVHLPTSAADAAFFAKKIVNSPLVKTAVHGADPNWGRIVMAIGKPAPGSPLFAIDPRAVQIEMLGQTLYRGGAKVDVDLPALSAAIAAARVVTIEVTIGARVHTATVWGCDLSNEYVHENAHYTT